MKTQPCLVNSESESVKTVSSTRNQLLKIPNQTKPIIMMLRDREIKAHLKVLNIDCTNQPHPLPSFTDLRQAFRMQLIKHPDKGGNTEHFQKITQAFRLVMEYCLEHTSLVKPTPDMESKPEKSLLEAFETENKVEINDTCVVVHVEQPMVDLWMESFNSYFTLKEQVQAGWQYKDPEWKAPGTNMEPGTLSVIFFDKSKSGPKFMVQGQHYLAFVTLVLPKIAETLGKTPSETNQILLTLIVEDVEKKEEEKKGRKVTDVKKATETEKISVKPVKNVVEPAETVEKPEETSVKSTANDTDIVNSMEEVFKSVETTGDNESNPNSLENQLKRLQFGIIAGFRGIESKLTSSMEKQINMESKVESLTTEIRSFKDNMNPSTPETTTTPIEKDHIEKITTRLDAISTIIKTSTQEINTNVKNVETNVIKAIKRVEDRKSEQVDELKSEWKEVKETVISMNTTVDSLMQRVVELFSKVGRPSPFPGLTPTLGEEVEEVEKEEPKVRKGIIFTDSINRDIDVERFENTTRSKVEVVKTNRIVENSTALNPESHLDKLVNEHMKKEHDFAVFMVGTNDITDIKPMLGVKTKAEVQANCDKQSTKLVKIAEEAANKNSAEVFLSEMIPRYDCSNLEQLSKLTSSQVMVKVAAATTERLHLVGQGGLSCPTLGKKREELYKNNIHLTQKGLYSTSTNLILSMHEVYQDMRDLPVHAPKSAPTKSSKKQEPDLASAPKVADTRKPPPPWGPGWQGGARSPQERVHQPPTSWAPQPGSTPHHHQQGEHHQGDKVNKRKQHKNKAYPARSSYQEWAPQTQTPREEEEVGQQSWAPENRTQDQELYYEDPYSYRGSYQPSSPPEQYWIKDQAKQQQYYQGWDNQYYGGQY